MYCTGIISSMDVMQVILPMCSDRVDSAIVIFDVFQQFPISVMAFHMDKLVIFKNTKFDKCAICVPSLMSTTANSQTINSDSSPDQMETSLFFPSFSPPLPHSFSVFVSTTPLSQRLVCSRNGRWWYSVDIGHTVFSAMLGSGASLLTHTCTDIKQLSSIITC